MPGDSTPLKAEADSRCCEPPATFETSGRPTPIALDPENENRPKLSAYTSNQR
ncbi:hypothetical protein FOXYSP1_14841 [Fusarium oxysporum f. sp. phaseoli]